MSARRALGRFVALASKRRMDRELDEEIRAHLEAAEEEAAARGLSGEEARRDARLRFGGIEQVKEEHRDRRGIPWMETQLRDFRYGSASLRRAPGFTAIVIGVLGMGIGATVAMFSVVDAVLLKPLPFPEPESIVGVWEAPRPGAINSTTVPQFLAWKRAATVFEGLSAEQSISMALNDKGGPRRLTGKLVTAEYFRVFATGVALGRTFLPEDDQPGAAPVVVLSHAAWESYFGGDPDILRRRVMLDGEPSQVVGILQAGAFDRDRTQFWRPLIFSAEQRASGIHWLTIYGRLRAGVTLKQAHERMQAVYAALVQTQPIEDRGGAIAMESLSRLLVGADLKRMIVVAFGAVLLLLLIACANVANLLFARGATRGTELAVRTALGAGRGRLAAQLFTESLVLCLLGGVAGVAMAYLLIRLATPLLAQALPFTAEVRLNPEVLAFASAVVLGVAIAAGVFPALRIPAGNLADSLKPSMRGAAGGSLRVRNSIVIGELGLSLVLLCGALLLARSFLKLQQIETGVHIENIVTMSIDLPTDAYPTAEKARLFYQALIERLHSVREVRKAGLSTDLPLQWISNGEGIQIAGAEKPVRVRFKRVDPGYFGTLDIPVLTGRGITERDRDGSPRVVVINQALAARLAEEGIKNPVGRAMRLTSTDYQNQSALLEVQIAGIIRSERTASPGYPDPAVAYVPLAQAPSAHVKLLVRTSGDTMSTVTAVRQAIGEVDPHLPLEDVAMLQQVRDDTLAPASRPAWVLGAFASLAVLLAGIGLYGVMAHSVAQQYREIGIRMALGARPGDVVSQILRGALATVVVGLVFGLAGTFALTRVMTSLLFEVSPLDPIALAAACVLMTVIGLMAGFAPANRASRVDPAVTLRDAG